MPAHTYQINRLTISIVQNIKQQEFLYGQLQYKLKLVWKTVWNYLVKIKIHKSDDQAIVLVVVHAIEIYVHVYQDMCMNDHSYIIHKREKWKTTQM